jgi:guanylate kinase
LPVVVAGPSGVGKGTLIGMLLKQYPNLFGFSVSHTTRAPREGEVNGVHYNFITVEEFEKLISENQFIEYAKVHTNYYGTSIMAVESVREMYLECMLAMTSFLRS